MVDSVATAGGSSNVDNSNCAEKGNSKRTVSIRSPDTEPDEVKRTKAPSSQSDNENDKPYGEDDVSLPVLGFSSQGLVLQSLLVH